MGESEVGEGPALFRLYVFAVFLWHGARGFGEVEGLAGDELAAAETGHYDGHRAILRRGAIAEGGAVGEDGVVQQ